MRLKLFLLVLFAGAWLALPAQFVHGTSDEYVWPDDTLVLRKLDKWQDQKFGMIIHWGLYSVPGIVESWSICSEDEEWIPRDSTMDYNVYKEWYWGLSKVFNPVSFNPEQWARAGKAAGMNYLVFTTKHHDGFCMFDSKETDFTIAKGPFAQHPKADVAKHVFEAFRQQGYMIGAYFSKPDWHSEHYWWPRYATATRRNNYDVRKHPWKWELFKQYTFNQLSELMHHYGNIDILWLDGGWVAPVPEEKQTKQRWSADIDMPRSAAMAREAQPGLLMVDRMIHGPYENYQTPEQAIPPTQLPYPWETCMTLGTDWGYVPNQSFKTSAKVVHSLIEIVAKGGSLLLGVGPTPEGLLPGEVVTRLAEIGKWTARNGEAIYSTRIAKHYNDGSTWFTQSKDGQNVYAMVCLPEGSDIPAKVEWEGNEPDKGAKMVLLHTGKTVKWKKEGAKTVVTLPKGLPVGLPALAFSYAVKTN